MDLNLPIFNQNLGTDRRNFNRNFSLLVRDSFERKPDRNMNTRVIVLFAPFHNRS